jgi:methanethiol S-methyltransferase
MTPPYMITNTLLIAGSFALFAVLHSLTAGTQARDRLGQFLGARLIDGIYRLIYNAVSVVTLLIPLVLVSLLPDFRLYQAKPPLSFVLIFLQVIGAVGVVISLLQIDLLSFSGLRQFVDFVRRSETPHQPARLQTGGLYRWMRHPLYVFSLLAIWSLPLMTFNILIFNSAATLYFGAGSIIEERRLERQFGEEYRQYKQRVGWLGTW